MGIVLPFDRHHASISADLKPKTVRSADLPSRANSSEKVMKYRGGIRPAAFQLETAGAPTPVKTDAAVVPPTASMMASTDESMPSSTSWFMKKSSLHEAAIDADDFMKFDVGMADDRADVVFRLTLLPKVLGKNKTSIAKSVGVSPSAWSNYINPDPTPDNKTTIPWETATELKELYGLTLDWIYCGDLTSVRDQELRDKIRAAERAAKPRKRA